MRRRAREFALSAISDQRANFSRWGLLGDWEKPYLTMSPEYEAIQLGVFYEMFAQGKEIISKKIFFMCFQKGLIYRAKKPVFWSPSSKTALAEAELHYVEHHKSQAIFVKVCSFDFFI